MSYLHCCNIQLSLTRYVGLSVCSALLDWWQIGWVLRSSAHIDVIQDTIDTFGFFVCCLDCFQAGALLIATRMWRLRAGAADRANGIDLSCTTCWLAWCRCWRRNVQVVRGEVRLQLLEQDEHECDTVLLWQLLKWCLFDLLDIEVQVSVWLKNVGLRVQHVIEELCKKKCRTLVLLLRRVELALKILMLEEKRVVLLLLHDEILLLLLQFLLHEVDQVVIAAGQVTIGAS